MRAPIIAAAGLVVFAAWRYTSQGADIASDAEDLSNMAKKTLSGWSLELVPVQYRAAIANAETANNLPSGMLARLLWQESRYRADIIDGRKKSPVGALGIAQFMPATARELGLNPLDPIASIAAAGKYLAWCYRYVGGGWDRALAAYNWGAGNVTKKGLGVAPAETVAYYTGILGDIA